MKDLQITEAPTVQAKFKSYPVKARKRLEQIRDIIYERAGTIEHIDKLDVSLKWGEPSFSVIKGSPIRIDWKDRAPDQVSVYFNCSTVIVATIREVYRDIFTYEKNRALHFPIHEPLPSKALSDCIGMALEYQTIKDKPFLGRL